MDKIILLFARNKMLVNILVLVTFSIGIYCYFNIQQESFPSTEFDMVIIQAVYPGASPIDVEKNAVVPIESELQQISGIDEYTSVIVENAAIVTVLIDQDLPDKRPTKDEIFRTMQNVPDISSDIEEIRVIDVNPKLMAVYTFGLHFKKGMEGTEKELFDVSERLEQALLRLDNVSEMRVNGRTDPEVQILVNPARINGYYLSLNDIVTAVEMRNVRATGGDLEIGGQEQSVVTIGEFESPLEVNDVIIRSTFDGRRVRVDDIATINEGFVEKDVLVKINQTSGYSLSVVKKEKSDIIRTIDEVNKYLKDNPHLIPDNMEITPMKDASLSISSLISVVTSNLVTGFIIIFIILFIFLDVKSALYTSVGMVFIICLTLIYMTSSDITFNIISLSAIITVLGMIVDNSIVVSENIFNFRQKGYKGLDATRLGVKEVLMPIIVSSMTTITAFAPMLAIKGIMGKFINQFPKVVIVALLASFIQAIFILPNQLLGSDEEPIRKKKKKKRKSIFDYNKDALFDKMRIPFTFILDKMLKLRYFVVLGFVLLLVFSIFLAQDSFSKFVLVYDTSADTIIINIDSGVGTAIETTEKYIEQIGNIVDDIVQDDELIAQYTLIGKQVDKGIVSEELGSLAGIMVYLVPITERKRIADDISALINTEIDKTNLKEKLASLSVSVESPMAGAGKAVDIKVVGNDTKSAKIVKDKVKDYLVKVPGVINYDDDDKVGKEELRVVFNYEKIAELGINVATVAREVRTAYTGTVATYIQGLDNKLDFRVQLQKDTITNISVLENILIPNNENRLVPLKNLASITATNGVSTLRHFDGERAITITADIEPGKNTSRQVMDTVKKEFKNIPTEYPGITIEFGGEAKETVEAIGDLLFSFGIAIIAIYIVLLLQFNKFIQPIIILSIIPFGLIGVLLAFSAHKMPMSFMGFIGIIGLAGVVVNNGIIMVDLINKIIDDGVENTKAGMFNAILDGAGSRLRPVFLTSATTILGLLPTVYGIGGKSDTIVPIVMAMAYGLMFASMLTLIFLPCLFMISFDLGLMKIPQKKFEMDIEGEGLNFTTIMPENIEMEDYKESKYEKEEYKENKEEDNDDEKIEEDKNT